MKKVTLILVATLITLGANAQIKVGVKVGANLSSISAIPASVYNYNFLDASINDGMTVGFHVGGFLNYSLGEFIGIQPELMFSTQGGKQQFYTSIDDTQQGMDFVFNYINLPVLLEVKPMSGLSILLGPQVGMSIYKSVTIKDKTLSGADFDTKFDNSFDAFDISIAMGLQYTFAEHFIFGARYTLGLKNAYAVTKDIIGIKLSADGWKNNVIQLYFGYAF